MHVYENKNINSNNNNKNIAGIQLAALQRAVLLGSASIRLRALKVWGSLLRTDDGTEISGFNIPTVRHAP